MNRTIIIGNDRFAQRRRFSRRRERQRRVPAQGRHVAGGFWREFAHRRIRDAAAIQRRPSLMACIKGRYDWSPSRSTVGHSDIQKRTLRAKSSKDVDLLQPPDLFLGARAPLEDKAVLPRQVVERVRRPRLGRLRAQLQSRARLVQSSSQFRRPLFPDPRRRTRHQFRRGRVAKSPANSRRTCASARARRSRRPSIRNAAASPARASPRRHRSLKSSLFGCAGASKDFRKSVKSSRVTLPVSFSRLSAFNARFSAASRALFQRRHARLQLTDGRQTAVEGRDELLLEGAAGRPPTPWA